MSSKVFVNKSTATPIDAAWLNDVNSVTYGLPISSGSSLVGYLPAGTNAVATTAQAKLRERVSVFDYMTAAQIADVQSLAMTLDCTAAILAAIANQPLQGTPYWLPFILVFPPGKYKITSKISINDQQGSMISGYGAQLHGNFAGTVLEFGTNALNNNHSTIEGLAVVQLNKAVGSYAVWAQSNYSCRFRDCTFLGGYNALTFLGNNCLFESCSFTQSGSSLVFVGAGANNEVNTFFQCDFELCTTAGYGIEDATTTQYGGQFSILSCYWEQCTFGCVYLKNTELFTIRDGYMNVSAGPGIILDGAIGSSTPKLNGTITGMRIAANNSGTASFISEVNTASINCTYSGNILENAGSSQCNMYGLAPRSVNLDRLRKAPYIVNADTFAVSGAVPTGWTIFGGGGVTTTTAAISPYGGGASVIITQANSYIWQAITVPANALIRVAVYVSCTANGIANLQLWSAGLGGQYIGASSADVGVVKLEVYLTPATRANATSFDLLLRNTGTAAVQFCDIEIEDMTN